MTVLQVIALHPYKIGSFEEYSLSFTKEMNKRGHNVIFVFGGEPHPHIKEKLNESNTTYYIEEIPQNALGMVSMFYRLLRLILNTRPDIVQGQFHPHDHLAVMAGFLTGRPAYRTIHTTSFSSIRRLKYSSIVKANISSFLSKSTFAVSNAVKKDLIANLHVPAKKIRVLYNGVNLKRYCPKRNDFSLHSEIGISKSEKIILTVAHARPEKGLNYLIEAVPSIIKAQPKVHFIFCGGGPMENNLIQLGKDLGVSSNIHFLGARDDIPELLNCSYIFALPSLVEAQGLAVLEAMAMEKAVVACDVEGIPEVVEHGITGLLVPPKDSKSLSEAIITLLDSPEKTAQMGIQGRKRAENLFDLNKRVANEIRIYEDELGLQPETR